MSSDYRSPAPMFFPPPSKVTGSFYEEKQPVEGECPHTRKRFTATSGWWCKDCGEELQHA